MLLELMAANIDELVEDLERDAKLLRVFNDCEDGCKGDHNGVDASYFRQ